MSDGHRVGRLSALSFLALVLERVISLALIAVVAALFGVTADTDTYFLALIVPAALGYALVEALYTVFVPFFAARAEAPRPALSAALRVAVVPTAVLTGAYVAAVLIASPRGLAVWLAFSGALFAAPPSGVFAGFLIVKHRYAVAALRIPFISAVALLVAVVLLSLWQTITALAIAVSVGQLASLGLLIAVSARLAPGAEGQRRERASIRVLRPAPAVFVATLVGPQMVIVLERALASTLAAGAVTLLVNARGFVLVPAMAAQALAIGVFPAASERYRTLGHEALAGLALTAVRLSALIALVSAAYVAICRRELVEVVLERGKFGSEDARETARLIAIMAPSLIGVSGAAVAGRTLFGVGRQRVVAIVSAGAVALYVAFAVGLREVWGVEGLAAAFVASSIAGGAALGIVLARALELPLRSVVREWLVVPAALALVFAAAAAGAWLAVRREDGGVLASSVTLVVVALAGLGALAIALVAARAREWELLRGGLLARWTG